MTAGVANDLDRLVGRVAGAIIGDVAARFDGTPPVLLVPTITFKVRRILEHVTSLKVMTAEQKEQLIEDLEVSIIPLLFALEFDSVQIHQMAPVIRAAARRAFEREEKEEPPCLD